MKSIFIHVPKTAGGSISRVMKDNGVPIDPLNQDPGKINYTESEYILPQFKNFDLHVFDYSFAFVRNTYDRLVSAFHTPWANPFIRKNKNKSIKEKFAFYVDQFVLKESEHSYFKWSHVIPYMDTRTKLFDSNGEQRVTFLGHFENLQQDFKTICDNINITDSQLPHRHRSKHLNYTEYYDDRVLEIVTEVYKKDIEHFGYTFGD